MRSASSKTFCSTSLKCFSSFDIVTIPTTDHRHVEVPAQLILQAAQNLPLVLQRLRVRDVQLEGEQTDRHQQLRGTAWRIYLLPAGPPPCPAASAALILVTLKHSRISPTFTSLKLATPAPHSKPVRTSLASSLNRFNELSFDV